MRPFSIIVLLAALAAPAGAQGPPAGSRDASAGYYFLLGRHLENQGKIDEAIAAHKKAIALDPQSAELHAELAGLHARQNRVPEAVEAAEAALRKDAANHEANRILGSIYAALSEQGQPLRPGDDPSSYRTKALAALERARDEKVFDVNVELMLGRLYVQAGDHARAVAPLRRVVDDQPGYPEAAMLLAAAYEESGQPEEAARVLEATIEQNPSFFRGRVRLAEIYEAQRKFKQAADTYAAAQAVNVRADLTAARATALINAGEAADARRLLQTALERKAASDGTLLYLLAQAQRRLGDKAGAAATTRQLKEAFPADLRGVLLDAQVAEDAGRLDEAIAAFKTLLEKVPGDSSFVYQYASLLEKQGRGAEAEAALRRLIDRDPLDADALNSLGYMFAERGERLDEAVDLLKRALVIEPANPSFLDSLGWAYFQQGRVDLADGPLSKAAAELPTSSAVQDHMGDLRHRQQRFAEAVESWQKALDGDGDGIDRARVEQKLRDARDRLKK